MVETKEIVGTCICKIAGKNILIKFIFVRLMLRQTDVQATIYNNLLVAKDAQLAKSAQLASC